MSKTIDQKRFTKELFDVLDETFENHHGIFLDEDTSLFTTLDTITAAEASIPVGGKCATLAAGDHRTHGVSAGRDPTGDVYCKAGVKPTAQKARR